MLDAGLSKKIAEMSLDCGVCNAERFGNLGASASDLDESEQNPQFGRCQLVSPGDGLERDGVSNAALWTNMATVAATAIPLAAAPRK